MPTWVIVLLGGCLPLTFFVIGVIVWQLGLMAKLKAWAATWDWKYVGAIAGTSIALMMLGTGTAFLGILAFKETPETPKAAEHVMGDRPAPPLPKKAAEPKIDGYVVWESGKNLAHWWRINWYMSIPQRDGTYITYEIPDAYKRYWVSHKSGSTVILPAGYQEWTPALPETAADLNAAAKVPPANGTKTVKLPNDKTRKLNRHIYLLPAAVAGK